ncbi:integrase arm-type DNA-binding domain-containing protein, partial [Escherichia coli]
MALTARQVETARPKEKDYKLSDERGLYLLVKTTGARYWRLKYRIAGKEKKLALGVYPDVSLAEARIKRDDARKIISEGGDPGEKKRKEKLTQKISATNTFHALATEWHQHKSLSWSESYARSVLEALDKDIFPYLGKRSVTD